MDVSVAHVSRRPPAYRWGPCWQVMKMRAETQKLLDPLATLQEDLKTYRQENTLGQNKAGALSCLS